MPDRLEKLAIVARTNAFSLGIVQSLSSVYRVEIWSPDDEVVAMFREVRPALVLVIARVYELERRGALARRLKTEMRPPKVAMVAPSGLPVEAPKFRSRFKLDGLFGGDPEVSELLAFVEKVVQEEQPVSGRQGRSGRVRGALRRLSEWSVFSADE